MTSQRKSRLKAIWRSGNGKQFIEWWEDYFKLVQESTFLAGDNDRGWTANFDWILKPSNMVKIEERSYVQGKTKAKPQKTQGGSSVSERNEDVFADFVEG